LQVGRTPRLRTLPTPLSFGKAPSLESRCGCTARPKGGRTCFSAEVRRVVMKRWVALVAAAASAAAFAGSAVGSSPETQSEQLGPKYLLPSAGVLGATHTSGITRVDVWTRAVEELGPKYVVVLR
jgi:hypothetical protein